MQLDERKKRILLAIIQDYIATAEPVGSRTIAKKYELGVSPATIRNEMADLEDMGYIEQPHTSAGRIPSDLGYRYYVDFLMEKYRLADVDRELISQGFETRRLEVAQVIQRTGQLLSQMTNYTTIVLGPQPGKTGIRHVQLVPVETGKALLVMVSLSGLVQNRLIEIPENLNAEDLWQISQVLNAKLHGKTISDIRRTLLQEIYSELARQRAVAELVLDLLSQEELLSGEEKVYLAGTLNILNQPEFRNLEKIKTLLSLLEQEEQLRHLVQPEDEGMLVRIGAENPIQVMRDCSMITATYTVDGQVVGAIGVLGPTRMEYARVMALVEYITENLSLMLSEYYRRS